MKGYFISVLLAFSAGLLGALQGTINAQAGKVFGQFAMIIGVSLTQVFIASMILMREGWSAFAPVFSPWMIVAGALGVIMMFSISSSISSIGTLPVFVLVILGQIIASALIDHFGLFGTTRPLSLQKLGSIFVIMMGVFWLVKSS